MAGHAQPHRCHVQNKGPLHFSPHSEARIKVTGLGCSREKPRRGYGSPKLSQAYRSSGLRVTNRHGDGNSSEWWRSVDSHSNSSIFMVHARRSERRPQLRLRCSVTDSEPLVGDGVVSDQGTVLAADKQQLTVGNVSRHTRGPMGETAVSRRGTAPSQEGSQVSSNGVSRRDSGIVVPVRGRMAHAMKAATREVGAGGAGGVGGEGGVGGLQATPLTQIYKPDGRVIRPHRIILVRHGQSEGNVDETAYTRIPDSKIALTHRGWEQAVACGRHIRHMVEADGEEDWKVYFYVSPYTRTLQTLRGIGLAFERQRIAGVREEPRIREQDFGNFQDRERMRMEKKVRLRYGRFFYRFPDGESAADVYDRVTGFRETLRTDIDVGRFQRPDASCRNMNLVLASHGLTLRVFLMRWYKWTVEQFEGLFNFSNAGMMVMQLGPGGRYSLRIHHSREELKAFGMTDAMIDDQEWQIHAKPGELNCDWPTSGAAFFDHFDDSQANGITAGYECRGLSSATLESVGREE